MPPEIPSFGVRKPPRAVAEEAAAEFERRQERRLDATREEPTPRAVDAALHDAEAGRSQRVASATAQPRSRADVPASNGVRRSRGSWTRAQPYVRADGVATRSTTVYLPVALGEALRRFAFEADRRQSEVIEEALSMYLDGSRRRPHERGNPYR